MAMDYAAFAAVRTPKRSCDGISATLGPMYLLVVEDEIAIAEPLLYVLRTDGFAVVHAVLGSEALATLESETFDLAIFDIGLPDISGIELLRRVRAGARHAALPVIFLTARSEEIDRVLGLELGADDYVTKPFSPREVAARVRAILRRGTAAKPPAGLASPWQRDPQTQRIRYHGRLLDLTRYEYRLLDLLLAHPDRIYPREEIMARVWGDAPDTLDRTIDAHVKTLRAKLREVGGKGEPIRTHRGMGYSLVVE